MDKYGFTGIERLQHIFEAIEKIQSFCKGVTEEKFIQDDLINGSVLYQFIIIGEAILYVDHEILKRYPYTWHLPRSFRNYVAHEYFGINLKQVYKTVKEVLPDFKNLVKEIITKEKQ
jgi:uncharacterized protein with HEPN domain